MKKIHKYELTSNELHGILFQHFAKLDNIPSGVITVKVYSDLDETGQYRFTKIEAEVEEI